MDPWLKHHQDEEGEGEQQGVAPKRTPKLNKPSDVDLYEARTTYKFQDATLSPHLPHQATPEEQVKHASLFDFFRLVQFKGGKFPYLQWYDAWDPDKKQPIVSMSPVVKLTEGSNFPFHARWALMQHHPWTDRHDFMEKSDEDIKIFFRQWRQTDDCPWHVKQQYLQDNNRRVRGGAGPMGKRSKASTNSENDVQLESAAELGEDEDEDEDDDVPDDSETEHCSSADEKVNAMADADTHVLKLLYKGERKELDREAERYKNAHVSVNAGGPTPTHVQNTPFRFRLGFRVLDDGILNTNITMGQDPGPGTMDQASWTKDQGS